MRFQNKVVIVTGASAGIGAAIAVLLAEEGAAVVAVGRNEARLKEVEQAAERAGGSVLALRADVTSEDDAKRIIDHTLDKFGKLDVLVNNAGIVRQGSILDGKLFDTFDVVMNTNLRSVVYLTTLAAPHLIKTKGNIVNISSIAGKSVLRSSACISYLTSKAALDHFSRAAALELGAHGVRVNIVSPGPIRTDILQSGNLGIDMEALGPNTVLKRIGEPIEVAKLVAFLSSDDALGVTGSDYVIDNGQLVN